MNTLQNALLPNGVLAFTSGLVMVFMREQLAQIFGLADSSPLMITGIVVTVFGLTVLAEVKMQRALASLWIILQDTLWVIGTIILVVWQPFDLTAAAYWIIALYALPVLVFIWFQSYGLSLLDSKLGSARKIFTFKRRVFATKKRAWEVMSDVSRYHEVAPNIDGTQIISGQGQGLVRRCSHGKDSWKETCTLWDEGNAYSFEVGTNAPDYPYPLKFLKGTWSTNYINADETEVVMEFEFEYKKSYQTLFLHPIMKFKFTKVCQKLLDNWQEKMESKHEGNPIVAARKA